jgi:hypothetical protein
MHDRHQGGEQVAAGQQQQTARPERGELGIEQDGGNQVVIASAD